MGIHQTTYSQSMVEGMSRPKPPPTHCSPVDNQSGFLRLLQLLVDHLLENHMVKACSSSPTETSTTRCPSATAFRHRTIRSDLQNDGFQLQCSAELPATPSESPLWGYTTLGGRSLQSGANFYTLFCQVLSMTSDTVPRAPIDD